MSSTAAPSQPKNQAKKKMHLTDSQHAVVRPLPSAGLEGAFRVHFLPDSLREADLKIGDTCEISSDDGSTGYGIAWQAADSLGNRPKTRPAKMTETFKAAFGFQDGSKVSISQTDAKIYPAEKIHLSDVTPSEWSSTNDMDGGAWEIRIKNMFLSCEALAPGVSFEASGKSKKARKRFFIESIESTQAPVDSPSLFKFESRTEIVFPEGINAPDDMTNPHANGSGHANSNGPNGLVASNGAGIYLNTDRVGGLLEECRSLNRHLRRLLDRAEHLKGHLVPNNPILLHGYEGTGKSMLLEKLADVSGFRKVVRIDNAVLPGGTASANKKFIRDSFAEAVDEQPAIVVIDDLDQLAPTDDGKYAHIIASELENATKPGMRVMVVGTARSPSSIHTSLLGPNQFSVSIELPIPNLEAREQILNVLQGKPAFTKYQLSTTIAERTHGYTGKDVASLYKVAAYHGYERFEDECAEQAMGRSPTPPAYEDIMSRHDGSFATSRNGDSQRDSERNIQRDSQPSPEPNLKDFELALNKVKPTALREIFTEKPKTKWADIGGSDSIKERFDEAIEWPLKHKDLMLKLGINTPKGVLLYGPPGCSKTLTAQAVANTYKLNFIAVKGAELISMYVGESERAVREVFRKAKQAAPCVIFFDEIDSIGSERDSTGTKGLNVLTTLLNEMDGFEALKDVFILAATNKPASLDSALLRPGRFDSHVYLGPPNETARKEIIILTTRSATLAKDVNFDHLAQEMGGYSGAEIVRICENAKMPAFRRALRGEEDQRVSAADFESARKGVKKGITRELLEELEAFSERLSLD